MRFLAALAVLAVFAGPAFADEPLHLVIKDRKFIPQKLEAPAGVKFKLIVKNEDSDNAEFESTDLNREKVVPAGGEITVFLGPLDAGSYEFFDDFHHDNKGVLVAK
jgi:hypothetical protein